MKTKEEIYDFLFDRINNCCSLKWLVIELNKYVHILDDNDYKKIIHYYQIIDK